MMGLSGTFANKHAGMLPLADIAVGLSRMNRFGGQTIIFPWTVAHHSLVVEGLASLLIDASKPDIDIEGELMLHALLHDAHEAMTSDIVTSFKTGDMKALQRVLDARIYAALHAPMPTGCQAAHIKTLDAEALVAEARVVAPAATYWKIVEETGHWAGEEAVEIVRDVLTKTEDVAATYQSHVERALWVWGREEA